MEAVNNTVLIVDDDARNIFALKAVLRSRKFNCVTASLAEAVMPLLNSKPDIGIILLDMMMPEMDGYEVISLIRNSSKFATLPVIAVTAQAMAGDREKCIAAGANDYISKPIDVDQLINCLHKYLAV